MSQELNTPKKQKGGPQEGSGRPTKPGKRLSGKISEKHDEMLEEMVEAGIYKTRIEAIEAGIEQLYIPWVLKSND